MCLAAVALFCASHLEKSTMISAERSLKLLFVLGMLSDFTTNSFSHEYAIRLSCYKTENSILLVCVSFANYSGLCRAHSHT